MVGDGDGAYVGCDEGDAGGGRGGGGSDMVGSSGCCGGSGCNGGGCGDGRMLTAARTRSGGKEMRGDPRGWCRFSQFRTAGTAQ